MEMVYVGHKALQRKRRYALADLAECELLTFQRGSQPYTALMDMLRSENLEGTRVHAISSVSAMVQLVQAGFGVATLPREAVAKLVGASDLKILNGATPLAPLPIHASYRNDPGSSTTAALVDSALKFHTA
jgi:DNA-binding transcriptional LysR family regulator